MSMCFLLRAVPWTLVGLRLVLGPLLLWGAVQGMSGWMFAVGMSVAFVSDVFDGVIARKLDVATPKLRECDSWTDAIFCACVALAIWLTRHLVVIALWPLVALWIATDLGTLGFEWIKFRRFAAYHALSAKLGGLFLFLGVLALFAFNDFRPLGFGLLVATVGHLERMVMTWLLPHWTPDVLTLWHARRLRQTTATD